MSATVNVYVGHPTHLSQGIYRVARALRMYAPEWVRIVDTEGDADLRIGHVVGLQDMEEWCARGPYALIQYCLLTAEEHNSGASLSPEDDGRWLPMWREAKAVWSYYDLVGHVVRTRQRQPKINFYYAPLGVDATVFKPSMPVRKRFIVGTSGYVADSECVMECYAAARHAERLMFHLGPNLGFGEGVCCATGMSDRMLADFWSQCTYVAGLRRFEGFELPAIEGLMCGARPVMLDAPHYRAWFNDYAEFIPEDTPEVVTQALVDLFSRPARPITRDEREAARAQFHWPTLCAGFWEAIRCSL